VGGPGGMFAAGLADLPAAVAGRRRTRGDGQRREPRLRLDAIGSRRRLTPPGQAPAADGETEDQARKSTHVSLSDEWPHPCATTAVRSLANDSAVAFAAACEPAISGRRFCTALRSSRTSTEPRPFNSTAPARGVNGHKACQTGVPCFRGKKPSSR